jgi:hypothetical protein
MKSTRPFWSSSRADDTKPHPGLVPMAADRRDQAADHARLEEREFPPPLALTGGSGFC